VLGEQSDDHMPDSRKPVRWTAQSDPCSGTARGAGRRSNCRLGRPLHH
jgi:hypothetical protein